MHPALSIIAQLARTDVASIRLDLMLSRLDLSSSLGLDVLRAAINRRFKKDIGPLSGDMTVADFLARVDGVAGSAPVVFPNTATSGFNLPRAESPLPANVERTLRAANATVSFGHGIDIQEINAMPPWDGGDTAKAFYQSRFTEAELARACGQHHPRAHLCGLWCAKEAIRKSDPELLALEAIQIVIRYEPDGRPTVEFSKPEITARLKVVVSISHSAAYAVASAIIQRL